MVVRVVAACSRASGCFTRAGCDGGEIADSGSPIPDFSSQRRPDLESGIQNLRWRFRNLPAAGSGGGGFRLLGLTGVQLEAGCVTHLVLLGQGAHEVPERMLTPRGILPARPPELERAGGKLVPGLRPVGRLDGPEQVRNQ